MRPKGEAVHRAYRASRSKPQGDLSCMATSKKKQDCPHEDTLVDSSQKILQTPLWWPSLAMWRPGIVQLVSSRTDTGDTGVGHPVGTKLEVTIGREPVMERNWTRGPALDPSTNKQGSNGRSN